LLGVVEEPIVLSCQPDQVFWRNYRLIVRRDRINPDSGYWALSCWQDKAHARRKFFEAIKALPKEVRNHPTAAHEAVRRIDELYKIERDIGTFTDAERAAVRQDKAAPLLESLNAWASSQVQGTLPSGKLGEAFVYLRNQWPKLIRYVEDGKVAIDTNLAERAIRPFALGRRYVRPVIMHGAVMVQRIWSVFSLHFLFPTEPCRA
jgi:hypothetical protein